MNDSLYDTIQSNRVMKILTLVMVLFGGLLFFGQNQSYNPAELNKRKEPQHDDS